MPSVPTFTDAAIGRVVGQQSLARGFVYASTGRVLGLAVSPEGILTGQVRGNGRYPYEVVVDATGQLGWSRCSCFVGTQCKHVAALLIAYRRQHTDPVPPEPTPEWQRCLDSLLTPAAPRFQPRTSKPATRLLLGLRVEPVNDGPIRLRCRPVRPGKGGKWVQQNVSWSDLSYSWQHDFDPGQRAALNQLHQVAQTERYGYYGTAEWLELSGSPRLLWSALADLHEAGVALVPGAKRSGTVEVSPVPAELALDVRASGDDGALTVTPRLTLDGETPIVSRSAFLGEPTHGVVYELGPDSTLLLAPLTRPCDAATRSWLERLPGGLSVPAGDRERFLAEFVPRLRRAITLTSDDDSVDFPAPSEPQLSLTVRHGEPGQVGLDWRVDYRVGTRTIRCNPADAYADEVLRDAAAERERWTEVASGIGPWAARLGIVPAPAEPVRELLGLEGASFCAEAIPLLQQSGVSVEQTGAERSYRRSEGVPEVSLAVSETGERESDWFDLAVDVSLDGEQVPFDLLFAALAREQSVLILPSGTYFSLDRPELARLADLIGEARLLQDRDRGGLRINVRQPSLWEDLVACGMVTAQADRWQRAVAALAGPQDPVPPPVGLAAELRPYQRQGYAWLRRLWSVGIGGILADDMGLGKTLQALALICAACADDPAPGRPFLVVAPTSVVGNWAAETARFAPGLRVATVERTERKREQPLAELAAGADVVITSYTLLRIDAEHYEARHWRGLILDEAQFVKNYQAKTYACIRRLGVGFTVAMTGTPLENSLMDLWAMLSLTAPGMFPSPQKFTTYYRTPIERGEAPERLALLQRRIGTVLLRRTKEVVAAELPAKQEQVLEVALHERHARIYSTQLQRERQKVLRLIEDLDQNRLTVLASLTLLRQLSLEAALVDEKHEGVPSAKSDLLIEMLPELVAEGHRALVFSQFTRFLRRIGDRLGAAGVSYSYLDGQTRNRARVIEGFRSGTQGAFLISLKAGGFGLNLTEADYCFVCDPWWNPAAEAQAVDRAHRIGQTRPVMVYRLVSKDTIEEKVMALKARKEALFSSVLGGDGLPSGALTSADIRELLAD